MTHPTNHLTLPRAATARGRPLTFLVALAVVTVGIPALLTSAANALPLARAKSAAVESQTLLVRDGCGRGQRFSERRQGCVEDFDEGPRRMERGGDERDFRRGPPPRDMGGECGRGMRFSNSRQRCVFIDGRGEDRGVDPGAVAAGVAVGVIGAAVGPAARDNDDQPRRGRR